MYPAEFLLPLFLEKENFATFEALVQGTNHRLNEPRIVVYAHDNRIHE